MWYEAHLPQEESTEVVIPLAYHWSKALEGEVNPAVADIYRAVRFMRKVPLWRASGRVVSLRSSH